MISLKQIRYLLQKEFKLELRQKSSLNGILLYLVSTVFVAYLIFNSIEDLSTWIALFWIILVFASTNACINTFRHESGRQYLYYFSLTSAQNLIFSKIIFNSILIVAIALINLLLFSVLLGNPIENLSAFVLIIVLGSSGIAAILTLVSAIASKTNNNSTLTAILSFPILLPILLIAIKSSLLCGIGFDSSESMLYVYLLGLINLVIWALSYVLFPYLWRT